ncbi:MAG: hypothetical protein GXO33_08265 [Epsilonproteobacteria bacterium]|nr:hypothetical protein [Campylobacterota bacterium]
MLIQRLARFDLQNILTNLYKSHQKNWQIILTLFVINIIIFGQKLFFDAYPADDYMRFWGDDNTNMLITNSARWGQALLNKYVFVDKIQILPYLHGLVGIFCFTLMGYLSARFLEREKPFEIGIVTLLITATPPVAHNLFFSTNITTWLTLLLGLVGFFAFYRPGWLSKIFGVAALTFSIGNYQTILQIVLVLLLFKSLLELFKYNIAPSKVFWRAFGIVLLTAAAYGLSSWINSLFIHHYHLHETHRLAKAHHAMHWHVIMEHIRRLFQTPVELHHLNQPLQTLYRVIFLFSAVLTVFYALFFKPYKPHTVYFGRLTLTFTALALLIPLLNLPILVVDWIPTRAHLPLGWIFGGFAVLFFTFFKGFIRSLALVLFGAVILLHLYYITLFFDACHRQTEMDIRRANMVVERIRTSPGYKGDPIAFHIAGTQRFHIKGWYMKFQDPFDSYWAKYKFFHYFTDLKFHEASRREMGSIIQYLQKRGEPVQAYPAKNSVIVHDNIAMLILDPGKINVLIKKAKLLKQFPVHEKPLDVKAPFQLYLKNNTLYYYKDQCTQNDIRPKFFLRIYPKDPLHTYVGDRLINPFQTWDFYFPLHGSREGDQCKIAIELPTYEIGKIRTGQFGPNGTLLWDVNLHITKP